MQKEAVVSHDTTASFYERGSIFWCDVTRRIDLLFLFSRFAHAGKNGCANDHHGRNNQRRRKLVQPHAKDTTPATTAASGPITATAEELIFLVASFFKSQHKPTERKPKSILNKRWRISKEKTKEFTPILFCVCTDKCDAHTNHSNFSSTLAFLLFYQSDFKNPAKRA